MNRNKNRMIRRLSRVTDTQLRARVTDDVENHVFLFSIFWRAEPDDPIHTEIRTVINQHAPRFA